MSRAWILLCNRPFYIFKDSSALPLFTSMSLCWVITNFINCIIDHERLGIVLSDNSTSLALLWILQVKMINWACHCENNLCWFIIFFASGGNNAAYFPHLTSLNVNAIINRENIHLSMLMLSFIMRVFSIISFLHHKLL